MTWDGRWSLVSGILAIGFWALGIYKIKVSFYLSEINSKIHKIQIEFSLKKILFLLLCPLGYTNKQKWCFYLFLFIVSNTFRQIQEKINCTVVIHELCPMIIPKKVIFGSLGQRTRWAIVIMSVASAVC